MTAPTANPRCAQLVWAGSQWHRHIAAQALAEATA